MLVNSYFSFAICLMIDCTLLFTIIITNRIYGVRILITRLSTVILHKVMATRKSTPAVSRPRQSHANPAKVFVGNISYRVNI